MSNAATTEFLMRFHAGQLHDLTTLEEAFAATGGDVDDDDLRGYPDGLMSTVNIEWAIRTAVRSLYMKGLSPEEIHAAERVMMAYRSFTNVTVRSNLQRLKAEKDSDPAAEEA